MVSRRTAILGAISVIAPSIAIAKKPKSPGVREKIQSSVDTVVSEPLRSEYLPSPTRLKKLGIGVEDAMPVTLELQGQDIPSLFLSARTFFGTSYVGSPSETRKKLLEKKYPGYEIIPYLIAPADIIQDSDLLDSVEIIYMARRKNPKPTGSSDWLLEWVGPIESSLDIDIMGTTPKAKTYEEAAKMKSLGAGTNFQIYDSQVPSRDSKEFIVLATHYPQFGQKDPIIQTPFSEALASRGMVELGKQYFEELQTQVTRLLAESSWAEGLRDIEWYKIIQGLILTENMNPAPPGLREAEEIIHYERELKKVYATLGANRDAAFKRDSTKGAKGIVQFTQAAWDGRGEEWDTKNKRKNRTGIRHNFLLPGFTENPDFHTVIGDHTLSILAACAHVMSQYQEYKESKFSSMFHTISNGVKQVVLAAGYNSNNTKRVGDFSRAHSNGEGGHGEILSRFYKILSNTGADETRGYMRKFLFALKSLGYSVPENSFFRLHGYNPRE